MLKRLLVVALIFSVIIVGAIELVLPGVVARELSSGLQEAFGTGEAMTVKLRSFPAVRMLTGRLGQVSVVSVNVPAGALTLDTLKVTIENVSVNLRDLLSHKGLAVTHSGAKIVITVSEGSLERYLLADVDTLDRPKVKIGTNGMDLSGDLLVAGRKVPVTFGGQFALKDEHTVTFSVTRVQVAGADVPEEFVGPFLGLLGGVELSLDLEEFPLPLKGTALRQEEGKLVIEAVSP
jgi:hypothetical protein